MFEPEWSRVKHNINMSPTVKTIFTATNFVRLIFSVINTFTYQYIILLDSADWEEVQHIYYVDISVMTTFISRHKFGWISLCH